MAGELELADTVAKLTEALDRMNEKISKMQDNAFYIDEFRKTKNAKFKTFADLIKKEFKDYLAKLAQGVGSNKERVKEGEAGSIAEAGAERIGGPVNKVRIEEVNPAVFKMLRDILIGIMPKKEEEIKEKKKGFNFIYGLLALLAGVIVGVIEYIGSWFNKIKRLIKSIKVFQWLAEAFGAVRAGIFNAASKLYKMLSESKLFKRIESIWQLLLTSIKESSLFKKIKTFFSEESFLGRFFKRIGAFFRGEGKAGRALKVIDRALRGVGASIAKGAKFFMQIAKMVGGIGKTIFNALKKTPLFKIGKIIGRALGPVFLIIDMITNTIDSVKQQGLSFKSILDGLLGGIVSFLTIGILNFQNIKKLTDKITDAFSEGNIVEGVLRILLAVPDLIFQGIGKIATWIAGKIFGEDIKKKVESFFSGSFTDKIFGIFIQIKQLILTPIKKILTFIKDHFNVDIVGWAKDMLDKAPDWVKKLVGWAAGQGVQQREEKPVVVKTEQSASSEDKKKGWLSGLFGDDKKEGNVLPEKAEEEEYSEVYTKEPDISTENERKTDVSTTAYKATDDGTPLDGDKILEVLNKQLEIMTATKNYLEKLQTSNNVATSVNNQSVVQMSNQSGVNSWRQNVLSR